MHASFPSRPDQGHGAQQAQRNQKAAPGRPGNEMRTEIQLIGAQGLFQAHQETGLTGKARGQRNHAEQAPRSGGCAPPEGRTGQDGSRRPGSQKEKCQRLPDAPDFRRRDIGKLHETRHGFPPAAASAATWGSPRCPRQQKRRQDADKTRRAPCPFPDRAPSAHPYGRPACAGSDCRAR